MLMYRAAAFFCRIHAPDLLLGARATDEIYDEASTIGARGQMLHGELEPDVDVEAVEAEIVDADPTAINAAARDARDAFEAERRGDAQRPAPAGSPDEPPVEPEPDFVEPEPKVDPDDMVARRIAAAGTWPQVAETTEPDEAAWLDSAGTRYDPNLHAWAKKNDSPAVTRFGVFRKGRTSPVDSPAAHSAPAEAQADTPEPPATPPQPTPGEVEMPVKPSATLKMLLNAVKKAGTPADLTRLQTHPETAYINADELDYYRSALADKAKDLE